MTAINTIDFAMPDAMDRILAIPPYSLARPEKAALLTQGLRALTVHHDQHCAEYHRILSSVNCVPEQISDYYNIPSLPVRLFKEYVIKSISDNDVIKTMTSSGTSGQRVSKIYLDRETAILQTKVLAKIVSSFIGGSRLPMIIVDSPEVVRNREMFSARGAGILGFSTFGRDKIYALNENMELDRPGLEAFLEKHRHQKILMFGFTFMIWQHFVKALRASDYRPDLSGAMLIHGGGWKKLAEEAVTTSEFARSLKDVCGLGSVASYYGMVEQVGSIYMECEQGHLHSSIFSDVIMRRVDLSVADFGEPGIVEVVSLLPHSYPGHALLTEDEGVLLGEDDCACGRLGKYFKINGRLKLAELRGCSDSYGASFVG